MYPITSRFNDFESFRKAAHKGIDFAMAKGTELKAIVEGKIQLVDYGNALAGKTVVIKGLDGNTYIYGHLSEFKVNNGEFVKQGDLIGLSGNSGNVVGSGGGYHLDFSVKNEQGQFIDPAPYIEFIQNMNNPQYIASLLSETASNVSSFDLGSIMKQFTESLSSFDMGSFFDSALNIISIIFRYLPF